MHFFLYSLAVWRVSRLLVKEPGPGRIFVRLREASGIEHDTHDEISVVKNDYTPLHCVFCASVWVAVVMYFTPSWSHRLLAGSAITIIAENVVEYLDAHN